MALDALACDPLSSRRLAQGFEDCAVQCGAVHPRRALSRLKTEPALPSRRRVLRFALAARSLLLPTALVLLERPRAMSTGSASSASSRLPVPPVAGLAPPPLGEGAERPRASETALKVALAGVSNCAAACVTNPADLVKVRPNCLSRRRLKGRAGQATAAVAGGRGRGQLRGDRWPDGPARGALALVWCKADTLGRTVAVEGSQRESAARGIILCARAHRSCDDR